MSVYHCAKVLKKAENGFVSYEDFIDAIQKELLEELEIKRQHFHFIDTDKDLSMDELKNKWGFVQTIADDIESDFNLMFSNFYANKIRESKEEKTFVFSWFLCLLQQYL